MKEVPFIGRTATSEGPCVDPAKVAAISEMPGYSKVARNGSRFLPHLSQITKPLRALTQKDTGSTQQLAFEEQ